MFLSFGNLGPLLLGKINQHVNYYYIAGYFCGCSISAHLCGFIISAEMEIAGYSN